MKLYRLFQVPKTLTFEIAPAGNGVVQDSKSLSPLNGPTLCSPQTLKGQHMLIREGGSENTLVFSMDHWTSLDSAQMALPCSANSLWKNHCIHELPCENRHSAVVKHSAQLEKRLTGGPSRARDTSQSSAWWHRGSPGRLVMKVMLLMGKKNLASIVQIEERLPKHGIPTSTLPPGLLPCLSPWFLSSCNHSSASYDRLSHHLFTVAIPLFSIIELMWVIRVLR